MKEKVSAGERVREIRRKTRKTYSAEEKSADRVGRGERDRLVSARRNSRDCHHIGFQNHSRAD